MSYVSPHITHQAYEAGQSASPAVFWAMFGVAVCCLLLACLLLAVWSRLDA